MARTVPINYSLRSSNGYTIWLPPNIQDDTLGSIAIPTGAEIYDESATKGYPFGTKLTADDRVWKYCYAGGTVSSGTQRGCMNYNMQVEGACIGTAALGAYEVNWRISDCDYPAVTYTTKDRYEGGYLWIMHSGKYVLYKILSNKAATGSTAATDYVTCTLEQPLRVAVDATWGTGYPNIYSDCRADYPNQPTATSAVVCVAWDGVTALRYFWGQTWGPVWITGIDGSKGVVGNERMMVFVTGLIRLSHDTNYENYQPAGFILTNNAHTDDCLIMLQISP